jgi:CubicO group peptidase (beta-lactamase class C family)
MTTATVAEALIGALAPYLDAACVPGCGIAIIQPGQPPNIACYGVANLTSSTALTPTTLFPIASTSKAFNATIIAMLVAEGVLDWDSPVREYLPYFSLADQTASCRTSLRDLITMRTGLPRHDWAWLGNPQSRTDLVRSAAHLQMSAAFRDRFQYSNLSVTIAGHVAERVTGQAWEELVARRLLQPLGMSQTCFGPPTDMPCLAGYHENASRAIVAGERFAAECTAPSGGSIHSTLIDMAKWVEFNLTGKPDIFDIGQLTSLHAPQLIVRDRPLAAFAADAAYGLGWVIDHVGGERRVHHSGLLHDISTSVMLVPARNLGLLCVNNLTGPLPAEFLNGCVLDYLVHGQDPSKALKERASRYEQLIVDNQCRLSTLPRVPGTCPSHRLEDYVGQYRHPGYGMLEIILSDTGLVLHRGAMLLPLQHWHYDCWTAEADDLWAAHASNPFDRSGQASFAIGADGSIVSVSLRLEPGLAPFRFERTADDAGPALEQVPVPTTL